MNTVIAIDLGASNGRVMQVKLEGGLLGIDEVHRFPNHIRRKDGMDYWDIDFLFQEIVKAVKSLKNPPLSLGVDSWGVDFAFIGHDNQLLRPPFAYRNKLFKQAMDPVQKIIDPFQLFQETGVFPASINTLYQLYALYEKYPSYRRKAKAIVTMPNVFNFLLTGKIRNEFTHSSTTQLLTKGSQQWNEELMKDLYGFLPPLAPNYENQSVIASTRANLGLGEIKVIQVPGHDTASALGAMPIRDDGTLFMSCGTWVVLGIEVDQPLISREAYDYQFTNEGTVEGKYRFQRNNMGLWLLQECRKEWQEQGRETTYEEEGLLTKKSPAFRTLIEPDDGRFFNPPSMTRAIQEYARETNQPIPETKGEILRCILESLALKFRLVIEQIEGLSGRKIPTLHMAGGGIQNKLFCQFIANATGRKVQAGPVEASTLGNALSQFIALGVIKDWQEGQDLVSKSFLLDFYQADEEAAWNQAYDRFLRLIKE